MEMSNLCHYLHVFLRFGVLRMRDATRLTRPEQDNSIDSDRPLEKDSGGEKLPSWEIFAGTIGYPFGNSCVEAPELSPSALQPIVIHTWPEHLGLESLEGCWDLVKTPHPCKSGDANGGVLFCINRKTCDKPLGGLATLTRNCPLNSGIFYISRQKQFLEDYG